jgi:hypothetical protein
LAGQKSGAARRLVTVPSHGHSKRRHVFGAGSDWECPSAFATHDHVPDQCNRFAVHIERHVGLYDGAAMVRPVAETNEWSDHDVTLAMTLVAQCVKQHVAFALGIPSSKGIDRCFGIGSETPKR